MSHLIPLASTTQINHGITLAPERFFSLEDQIYRQIFGIFVNVVQIVNVPEKAIR